MVDLLYIRPRLWERRILGAIEWFRKVVRWSLVNRWIFQWISLRKIGMREEAPMPTERNPWVGTKFGLIELLIHNIQHTWSNLREKATCSKLDRFFISHQWRDRFPTVSFKRSPPASLRQLSTIIAYGSSKGWPSTFTVWKQVVKISFVHVKHQDMVGETTAEIWAGLQSKLTN